MIRAVLFDIDGTLIHTGGGGRRAFLRAAREITGSEIPDDSVDFAGRTDSSILRDLLARAGVADPDPALRARIYDRYVRHLDRELEEGGSFRLCPGVRELLAALEERPEFLPGLLTGNIEPAAGRKLAHLGIASAFRFGAYGSDDEDRNALVAIARRRAAAATGIPEDEIRPVLVGDTPNDIRCARASGIGVLAVATGIFEAAALEPFAPDVLLPDLTRTEEVVRILAGLSDPPPRGRVTPRRGG